MQLCIYSINLILSLRTIEVFHRKVFLQNLLIEANSALIA